MRELGAGDVARGDRWAAIARCRSSMFARRLLSSVEIARGRWAPDAECVSVLARLSSPKMASLCANKSRTRR